MSSSNEQGSSMSHEEAIHSASRRTIRICEVCNRTSRQGYTISLCAGCLAISYCGSKCQRSHWKMHKPICRQQAEIIEETKKANRMPVVDRLFQWQTIHLATLYYAAIMGYISVLLMKIFPRTPCICVCLNAATHVPWKISLLLSV